MEREVDWKGKGWRKRTKKGVGHEGKGGVEKENGREKGERRRDGGGERRRWE